MYGGHIVAFIVAGGILGITVGAGIGGALGYKLGVYSAWRLVTSRLGGDGAR